MTTPCELRKLHKQGVNISAFMRKEMGLTNNSREIIEISYDLQTGSYIAGMANKKIAKYKKAYSREIANCILSLFKPESILEAGVGEATTLSGVLENMSGKIMSYGFDLSWSRVAYAKKWLYKNGVKNTILCTGDLSDIPFLDSSIDVVYTSHSIEPNRGNEETILKELYRVTRKFLILLEPAYELASEEARKRMDFHGYCRNIKEISDSLGYNVLEHKLFPYTANPLNPTAITIVRKDCDAKLPKNVHACPQFKTPLKKIGKMLFSPEGLVVYPIVGGIPCLRIENGIFASKYEEIMKKNDENEFI